MWKSNLRRVRGDAGSSPLDRARTAASSPRYDLVKNCRAHPTHWLIAHRLFNIVLNSVAIVFVLHLDNYVDLDLPDRNFFRLATSEQLKRHAARSRAEASRRW